MFSKFKSFWSEFMYWMTEASKIEHIAYQIVSKNIRKDK
jgi:hypothetical protein